jgi:hypothetical protein
MLRTWLVMFVLSAFSIPAWTQICADVQSFDFRNATIQTASHDEGSHRGAESFHLRKGVAFISDDPDSLKFHDWRVDLLVDRTVHPDSSTWVRVIVLVKDHLTGTGTWSYVMAFGCQKGSLVRIFEYSSEAVELKHLDDEKLELDQAALNPKDVHC